MVRSAATDKPLVPEGAAVAMGSLAASPLWTKILEGLSFISSDVSVHLALLGLGRGPAFELG